MMLQNKLSNVLRNVFNCKLVSLRFSALFINGSKATETYVFVTPHVNFLERIKEEDVKQNLAKRNSIVDLDKVENLWTVYNEIKQQKLNLEKKKNVVSAELGHLMKNDPNSDKIEKLKIQSQLLKDNLKKLKSPLWSAEELAYVEALKLPNSLHSKCIQNGNEIIFNFHSKPLKNKNHLLIGKQLEIIHFKKNENYYLKGDAAMFELGAKFYYNSMLKSNNFTQFSNPDFVKSVIIEGCGENHTCPDSTYILHHNEDSKVNVDIRLHLTGGSSLYSFFAYYAKCVLHSKSLPLKYFSMGRQYVPAKSDEDSLFHVSQSSAIQFFCALKEADVDNVLQEIIDTLKHSYIQLGYHFRLRIVPAQELLMWESMKVAVEMYSTSMKSYVEVANVSFSGDFISKRLMLTYLDKKESKFPHIISGTVLNVPKFLACVLEQDEDFCIPAPFAVDNWTFL